MVASVAPFALEAQVAHDAHANARDVPQRSADCDGGVRDATKWERHGQADCGVARSPAGPSSPMIDPGDSAARASPTASIKGWLVPWIDARSCGAICAMSANACAFSRTIVAATWHEISPILHGGALSVIHPLTTRSGGPARPRPRPGCPGSRGPHRASPRTDRGRMRECRLPESDRHRSCRPRWHVPPRPTSRSFFHRAFPGDSGTCPWTSRCGDRGRRGRRRGRKPKARPLMPRSQGER